MVLLLFNYLPKLILLESKELYEKLKYKPFSSIRVLFQSGSLRQKVHGISTKQTSCRTESYFWHMEEKKKKITKMHTNCQFIICWKTQCLIYLPIYSDQLGFIRSHSKIQCLISKNVAGRQNVFLDSS
jgi:hypothetical protein